MKNKKLAAIDRKDVNINGAINEDVLSILSALNGVETNSDEVMHTLNTGKGKELIPVDVLQEEIIQMIPEYSSLLKFLPGNHGTNMATSEKLPIIGKVGKFAKNTEWADQTTSPVGPDKPAHYLPTAEVTITQGQFIASVALSKRQLNYTKSDLAALVKKSLAEGAAQTIDALILNADPETGATGNINLDDSTPPATSYYLEQATSIRMIAIDDIANLGLDVGAMDWSDFLNVAKLIGRWGAKRADCLWIFENETYMKALGVSEFKKANENGQKSTIIDGALTNILGSDLIVVEDFEQTEADGKVSNTASNNTKGGFAYIQKAAIQYGYGQTFEIEITNVAGKGKMLTATFEFGFTVVQQKAGVTDSSVALGYNVTL